MRPRFGNTRRRPLLHDQPESECKSGRLKLTQLTPEGHQVVLRIIGAGEAFGGAGAFGDQLVERRVARALLRLVHEAGRRVDAGIMQHNIAADQGSI